MVSRTAVVAFLVGAHVALLQASSAASSHEAASGSPGLVLLQRTAGFVAAPADGTGKASSSANRPRMLVMGGCSGSSFLMNIAHQLMDIHGIHGVYNKDGGEMLKPSKNKFFTENAGMAQAMVLAQKDAEKRGGSLFFKAMTTVLTETRMGVAWAEVAPTLKEMGTFVTYGVRENHLDRAVCEVRDCFSSNFGEPVDGSTGEKSDLCFNRRFNPDVKYQAKMTTGKLVKAIRRLEDAEDTEQQILRDSGFDDFEKVSMEDLAAYQYGNSFLDKSVSAWENFLTSWGVQPNSAAIKAHLKNSTSSKQKSPPGPHSEVIYNIDEVVEALKDADMSKYVRV